MNPEKVYLDTNLILNWFRLCIIRRVKKAEEEVIIKFLSEHKEIESFISVFSVAEIIANLRNEFKERVKMDEIDMLMKMLRNTINVDICHYNEFKCYASDVIRSEMQELIEVG